jgi:4,5-dihydroxyphthalate decarboxylase
VRGVLQHEYGVDLDKVNWYTIDESHLAEYRDPPNCTILPPGSNLGELLLRGELSAAILGIDMPKDPRVRTLVPDPMAEAQRWYQREGVFPINHLFVVHRDLSRKRPDVVREIYRMLVESRKLAPADAQAALPPIGLEANRKGLQMAIDWSYEQKIIPRRMTVDELFDDTTAHLGA